MSESRNEMHVVFGAGPAGFTLATELAQRGHQVRLANRRGEVAEPLPAGIELARGDASDRDAVAALSTGATTVYNCTHAPYERWPELLPRLQESLIEGAATAGAKLVVIDTLYLYGETGGRPMTEATPHLATSRKGRLRAQLAWGYLQAHRAGKVRVALGRSADFFGPRVTNSALGQFAFPPALVGQPIVAFGDVDLPHSYSFMPDVARGLATLGERDEALGRDWLLPVAPAISTRAVASLIANELGHPVPVTAVPDIETMAATGALDPVFVAEYDELFYQYTEPQIVDSSAFTAAFGVEATPMPAAIRATVAWYRHALSVA